LQGYNATVFVYGQTGSGKTFTIEGLGFTLAEYHGVTNNIQTDLEAGLAIRAIR
jgi:DNA replication protein DnaC